MSIRSALLAVCLMLTSSADSFAAIAQVQAPAANPNKPPVAAIAAGAGVVGEIGPFLCIAIFAFALIGLHVWMMVFTYNDAKKRGMDPTLWLVLELIFGWIPWIIYLCVREPLLSRRHRRDWEEDDDDEDRPRRRQRRPRDDDEDEHDRYHS